MQPVMFHIYAVLSLNNILWVICNIRKGLIDFPLSMSGYKIPSDWFSWVCILWKCKKTFRQKYTEQSHQLTHSAHRQYASDVCKKAFSLKSDFRRHELTHTARRPFACDVCKKKFIRQSNKQRHQLTYWLATVCLWCVFWNINLDVINGGTSIHPVHITALCAACPYICDICSNTLADLCYL
jgi:hypothetical protein